jgi:hypothetical protein
MLDLEADMDTVFFGPDFATTFTRHRPPAADLNVVAILGVADEEALGGHVVTAARTLRMPATVDVRADDVLLVTQVMPGMGVSVGDRFTVIDEPRRVTDGMEMEALLGSVRP